jgi:TolB protein
MVKKIITLLFLFGFASASQAVLKIDITEGYEGALPIAVVPFKWIGAGVVADGDVSAIVASDLARSGKFSPLAESDLIARPYRLEDVHYKTWRIAGMDHIVIGSVTAQPGGKYQVEFRLIDILKARQVLGYSFSATRSTLRDVAHQISDYVFTHITGLPGAFSTRIAYVTVKRDSKGNTTSRLQVADTDGYNPQTLLTSKQPIMSPAWSPDGSQLAYVSFENGQAEIFTQNVRTGDRKSRSKFKGLNGAPAWSPDGRKLALTLSKGGNPDIYILDLGTNKLRRLTDHWSIDTEPSWLPDGRAIVYTSSRSGKPQLYKQSISGGRPERLTFEGNYNASASVSPDGKHLAFVHGEGNIYRIAILELETKAARILTDGPLDESPEFAPNNSMILFASQEKRQAVLAAVSVDGRQKQRLAFSDSEVREPSWAAVRY